MHKKYAISLGIFIVLYAALIFILPPDQAILNKFHLTFMQLQVINLTLILLLAVIWYAAFYGFSTFKEYALKIIDHPDGRAFNTLADGLGVLAFALPLTSLISTELNYIARMYPEFTPATVITDRYIALVLAIVAITLIYRGSKNLAALASKKPRNTVYTWLSLGAVLTMGGVYAYVALSNTASSVPDPATGKAVYYLPVWIIIATNIIPYTCVWLLGLRSIALILFFKRNAQGLIYSRTLGRFALGLGLVVGASIVVQIFTALGNTPAEWGLQLLLVFIYILVIIIAIGYLLIALGAKKLRKIEEV